MSMAKLINQTRQPVTLPTRHIVPRLGELTTTNEVLRCPDNVQFLRGQLLSGVLTAQEDPDPTPAPEATASIIEPPKAAEPVDTPEKGTSKKGA